MTARHQHPQHAEHLGLQGDGDCYQPAFMLVVGNPLAYEDSGLVLVHGRPTLQVPPYCAYGHAWVEDPKTGLCSHETARGWMRNIPRETFYAPGNINEDECFRYTEAEARWWAVQTECFGPWEGPFAQPPIDNHVASSPTRKQHDY